MPRDATIKKTYTTVPLNFFRVVTVHTTTKINILQGAHVDKKIMLHHLRNPYGVDDIEMREARLRAADELERLYEIEKKIKDSLESLQIFKNDLDSFK